MSSEDLETYKKTRQEIYDRITALLAEYDLPWADVRTVLMQIKQDIYIAEGKTTTKQMIDIIRSARGNKPIE